MENTYELQDIRKKFEDLDGELDTFIQAIREIKEIREDVRHLPDRIKNSEEEIESRKKELDDLVYSTNNLLTTFQERAGLVISDLEKKTDSFTDEARAGISRINQFLQGNGPMLREDQEHIEKISHDNIELRASLASVRRALEEQDSAIISLQKSHSEASEIFSNLELALLEIKKNIYNLRKKPFEAEKKIKEAEERLSSDYFNTLERQKKAILITAALLMANIVFTLFVYFSL